MKKEPEPGMHFIRIRTDELDERCRQRLNEELGMDEESIEIIKSARSGHCFAGTLAGVGVHAGNLPGRIQFSPD